MSKRLLITGGTGFVGANLVRRALDDGHEVHLLVRQEHRRWRLEGLLDSVRVHAADLEDGELICNLVRTIKPDWIFHAAAYGAYSSQQGFQQMAKTNILGCASLLDSCLKEGFEVFVNCGSSSEYGIKDGAALETDVLAPNSDYAVTKAAATHYCNLVANLHGANICTLRLYSVYGPYEEPSRLIPTLLLHAMKGKLPPLVGPETARDFIYVDEVVDALLYVAKNAFSFTPGVFNLCTGTQTKLRSLVDAVRDILGSGSEPVWGTMKQRMWDSDIWVGSPEKLAMAGWKSRIGVSEGLRQTIAWFEENQTMLDFYRRRIVGES